MQLLLLLLSHPSEDFVEMSRSIDVCPEVGVNVESVISLVANATMKEMSIISTGESEQVFGQSRFSPDELSLGLLCVKRPVVDGLLLSRLLLLGLLLFQMLKDVSANVEVVVAKDVCVSSIDE